MDLKRARPPIPPTASNVAILPVVAKDLSISPRLSPTIFHRDASPALLHLVNQWLDFTYTRSHAFRDGRLNKRHATPSWNAGGRRGARELAPDLACLCVENARAGAGRDGQIVSRDQNSQVLKRTGGHSFPLAVQPITIRSRNHPGSCVVCRRFRDNIN